MTEISANKRIAKNTLFLYFRMLITMVVSLYTSRIVLNTLGVENYGIYNIVGGIVVLFSFINGSLSAGTQRFLNFELGKGDVSETQRVFSMSLTIHICVAIIAALLAETAGLWFLKTQLNIPIDKMNAANWVYQFSILTVFVQFIQVPYYSSVVAHEKMSFFAFIAIVEVVLKLVIVFLLFFVNLEKLRFYSVLTFLISILIFLCYKSFCNQKISTTKYSFFWDKNIFIKLFSFSGWMLFGSAASVSATQGVNILLNVFFSVSVNAAMGISNQVNSAVNQFVSNFQTAFVPQITKLYAIGNLSELRKLIYRSSRISFLMLFALAFPIMLNIEFILLLWLKTVPDFASAFCVLTLIYSLVETMSKPLGFAIHATGKVKYYNILMSIALLMNIIFSYVFLKMGFQPPVVLLISVIVDVLCLAIRLGFVSYYKISSIKDFITNVLVRSFCIVIFTFPLPLFLSRHFFKWKALIFSSLVFVLLLMFAVLIFGLTKSEREALIKILKQRIQLAK